MPWLDTVDFDESLLQEVSRGVYTKLLKIASEKDIQLHTVEFQKLTDCLARTYASVQKQAQIQQTVLERSSQMSIYQDGDRQNSDFDIMDDIRRINRLIFAEEIPYK